ncbi:MAG TPA: type II secretion system protein GspG [Pyrinomonadaceae bacterium]|jgi:hypothetical protein|nr:type II secretion system protein GspG [Pyrinomonadaceae bacterium]
MNLPVRLINLLLVSGSLWALTPADVRGNPTQNDLRKAIQTMLGSSLPSNAVQVREVRTTNEGTAEVSAEIQAVFRARQVDGRWRLSEIRTAPDRWEQLAVIAQALHANLASGDCDEPSQFVRSASPTALTMKRARCLVAELLAVTLPSDQVRIKDMSLLELPFSSESSALIEAFIHADFRFARAARGWHVSEVKTGNREWTNIENFAAALNEVKRVNATADLAAIADALIEFRRERGAFVVSDKESVLIDHLSPRYLTRVIRVDPWHRPYEYEGEQNQFSLRSVGPDGKPGTPDDIVVSGPR